MKIKVLEENLFVRIVPMFKYILACCYVLLFFFFLFVCFFIGVKCYHNILVICTLEFLYFSDVKLKKKEVEIMKRKKSQTKSLKKTMTLRTQYKLLQHQTLPNNNHHHHPNNRTKPHPQMMVPILYQKCSLNSNN